MKNFKCFVLLFLIFCFLTGISFAGELVILKGDGLKRDVTLSDMQKYVGGLADVSQKTWEAFIGQMPGMLSVAKDSMNAIAVHQELSKGSIWGAAKSILDYGIGFISGEWESAGYAPLATMMTAFSVYDASLDFINSQWFKPTLIDSVYDKYKAERDKGDPHKKVWDNFATYFINPIKADVKNKVIYPRHNLKDMGDDKKKATRWITQKVGEKTVKVTYRDKSNWPYSEAQKVYIRHSGKGNEPIFATVIDIEIWNLGDIDATTLDIMDNVYKLNDIKYPDLRNRFTSAQMNELEGKLKGMLKQLRDKDIGPELDAEAEEYIGQMLEARYAQEAARKLVAATEDARPKAERSLLDIARQLKQFEPPEPEAQIVDKGEKGPIYEERRQYVDLWERWMEAQIVFAQTDKKSPNITQALQGRNDAGRAFTEYSTKTFARIPEVSSNIMRQAMGRVMDIQGKVFSAAGSGTFPVEAARESIWAIEKVLLDPEPYRPELPAEGNKQTVMDNPQFGLKYWLVARNGHLYLEGYYHTANGKKVEYKSRPMDETDPLSAAVGLFATASGTGYHLYIEEKPPWQPISHSVLNITMMKDVSISEKGRFDIHQFGYRIGEMIVPFILEAPQAQGGAWVLKYKVYERRDDIMDISGLKERTISFD